MDKRPILLLLNCKKGIGVRYVRRFDVSGAGLGWQLVALNRCTFEPQNPIDTATVETFRANGKI